MYTLLSRDARRGLMLAYVVTGLAFTIAVGLLVVYAFHGIHLHAGKDRTKGVADIVGGIAALLFGLGVLTRRIGATHAHAPHADRGRHVNLKTAALAGPATH